jgi:protein O-mannosyl-transferase
MLEKLFQRRLFPYVAIALAVLFVWAHSLTFDFVWDDIHFIKNLESVRSLKNIPSMFTSEHATSPDNFKVFRPLRTVQYAILHWLGGKSEPQPWLFHLANLIWHAAAAMALFALALSLFEKLRDDAEPLLPAVAALVIALGFAVNPVTSEVVCWAKALDDLMAAFFILTASRLLVRLNSQRDYVAALFLFVLAMYSKEAAVPFAAVVFFIFVGLHRKAFLESVKLAGGFVAVAAVYLAHRHLVLGQTTQAAPLSGSHGQTLIDMLQVVPKYFRLLFGIPPFFIDYSFLPGHFKITAWPVLSGLLLLLALLAAALVAWRSKRYRLVGFGLLWTGLFLLPVSNLIPFFAFMAERFLYLPLAGWMIAIGALLMRLVRVRALAVIGVCVLVLWSVIARERSMVWKDALTLFVSATQQGVRIPRLEDAAVYAILHQPHMEERYSTNGQGKVALENASTIIHTLEEGLKLYPDHESLLSTLGLAYATDGKHQQAIPYLEAAANRNPTNAINWINLAQVNMEAGKKDQARAALSRAVDTGATQPMVLASASRLYERLADINAAVKTLEQLQKLQPANSALAERIQQLKAREDSPRAK